MAASTLDVFEIVIKISQIEINSLTESLKNIQYEDWCKEFTNDFAKCKNDDERIKHTLVYVQSMVIIVNERRLEEHQAEKNKFYNKFKIGRHLLFEPSGPDNKLPYLYIAFLDVATTSTRKKDGIDHPFSPFSSEFFFTAEHPCDFSPAEQFWDIGNIEFEGKTVGKNISLPFFLCHTRGGVSILQDIIYRFARGDELPPIPPKPLMSLCQTAEINFKLSIKCSESKKKYFVTPYNNFVKNHTTCIDALLACGKRYIKINIKLSKTFDKLAKYIIKEFSYLKQSKNPESFALYQLLIENVQHLLFPGSLPLNESEFPLELFLINFDYLSQQFFSSAEFIDYFLLCSHQAEYTDRFIPVRQTLAKSIFAWFKNKCRTDQTYTFLVATFTGERAQLLDSGYSIFQMFSCASTVEKLENSHKKCSPFLRQNETSALFQLLSCKLLRQELITVDFMNDTNNFDDHSAMFQKFKMVIESTKKILSNIGQFSSLVSIFKINTPTLYNFIVYFPLRLLLTCCLIHEREFRKQIKSQLKKTIEYSILGVDDSMTTETKPIGYAFVDTHPEAIFEGFDICALMEFEKRQMRPFASTAFGKVVERRAMQLDSYPDSSFLETVGILFEASILYIKLSEEDLADLRVIADNLGLTLKIDVPLKLEYFPTAEKPADSFSGFSPEKLAMLEDKISLMLEDLLRLSKIALDYKDKFKTLNVDEVAELNIFNDQVSNLIQRLKVLKLKMDDLNRMIELKDKDIDPKIFDEIEREINECTRCFVSLKILHANTRRAFRNKIIEANNYLKKNIQTCLDQLSQLLADFFSTQKEICGFFTDMDIEMKLLKKFADGEKQEIYQKCMQFKEETIVQCVKSAQGLIDIKDLCNKILSQLTVEDIKSLNDKELERCFKKLIIQMGIFDNSVKPKLIIGQTEFETHTQTKNKLLTELKDVKRDLRGKTLIKLKETSKKQTSSDDSDDEKTTKVTFAPRKLVTIVFSKEELLMLHNLHSIINEFLDPNNEGKITRFFSGKPEDIQKMQTIYACTILQQCLNMFAFLKIKIYGSAALLRNLFAHPLLAKLPFILNTKIRDIKVFCRSLNYLVNKFLDGSANDSDIARLFEDPLVEYLRGVWIDGFQIKSDGESLSDKYFLKYSDTKPENLKEQFRLYLQQIRELSSSAEKFIEEDRFNLVCNILLLSAALVQNYDIFTTVGGDSLASFLKISEEKFLDFMGYLRFFRNEGAHQFMCVAKIFDFSKRVSIMVEELFAEKGKMLVLVP